VIDKPVEGVQTDTRKHPAGFKGARLSLQEVAERAWKARMSPRLRAWVIQQLNKCGVQNGGRREKAQCILDAFRKKVPYVADPVMGEFMATPDQTLCLDEGGLCFLGGDCDDQSIGLAAAMMTIGIPAMIIGSSHRPPHDVPTHVYCAFEDDLGAWVKMDGTTKLPVGRVAPNAREWWVEPGEKAKEIGEGDFVGMSDTSSSSTGGALNDPASAFDLLYPGLR
jgi:transglutaminase-like putative cysteine protease